MFPAARLRIFRDDSEQPVACRPPSGHWNYRIWTLYVNSRITCRFHLPRINNLRTLFFHIVSKISRINRQILLFLADNLSFFCWSLYHIEKWLTSNHTQKGRISAVLSLRIIRFVPPHSQNSPIKFIRIIVARTVLIENLRLLQHFGEFCFSFSMAFKVIIVFLNKRLIFYLKNCRFRMILLEKW